MTKTCYRGKILHCTELVTNCFEWKTNHVSVEFYRNTLSWQYCHFCTTSNGITGNNIFTAYKRKFVKIMFSHVFFCPRGRGNLHPGGSASGGRGVCIREVGVCIRAVCIQEGLHPRGVCPTPPTPIGYYGIWPITGRYASDRNGFLYWLNKL